MCNLNASVRKNLGRLKISNKRGIQFSEIVIHDLSCSKTFKSHVKASLILSFQRLS